MSTPRNVDPELRNKAKKAVERISENMHIVANEPSLALYRLQEHVRKALVPLVEKRLEVEKLHQELQGRCYDVEYAVVALWNMSSAENTLKSIQEELKNVIYHKQQLKHEESLKKKSENSYYKRLSAHITLDLPDLPEFSDVVRETANRVESMMSQARQ